MLLEIASNGWTVRVWADILISELLGLHPGRTWNNRAHVSFFFTLVSVDVLS